MGSCYMKRAKKAASVEDFIVTSDLGLTSDDDLLPSGSNSPLSSGTKTTVLPSCMSSFSSQSNSTAPSQSQDTISVSQNPSEKAQSIKDAILKQSIRDIIFNRNPSINRGSSSVNSHQKSCSSMPAPVEEVVTEVAIPKRQSVSIPGHPGLGKVIRRCR